MDKLFQKGWLRREQQGRAYRYAPVSTREAYTATLMNDAWETSDNPAAALVHFFGMMSPEQQEALGDALRIFAPSIFPADIDAPDEGEAR
jgi:predicted transcriptional regulator